MADTRKVGGKYYAIWYAWDAGQRKRVRKRRSTGCTTKAAAQLRAEQWEREDADPEQHLRASATLGDALSRWLATVKARVESGQLAEGTLRCYETKAGHLARVLEHGGDPDAPRRPLALVSLTREHVDDYLARRTAESTRAKGAHRPPTPNTLHKELTALRCALKHARATGRWARSHDEVMPERYGPQYAPRDRWLPADELRALLADLLRERGVPGHAAVVAFVVATSAEWRCVERARRGDAAADRDVALLRGTKRATRHRAVPIELPWQTQLLAVALAHADGEKGAMFKPWTNVRRDLAAACVRAGIAPCTPTDLRRTCCHYLLQSGVSERIAGQMLGHANSAMVRRVYGRANATEAAEHLRALRRGELPPGMTPPSFGGP